MCSIRPPSPTPPTPPQPPPETATNDPPPTPIEHLEDELCELAAHLAATTCRWLQLLAEFDARAGWAQWGVKSCAHWLSWRCSFGLAAGREHVRVARKLRELPRVREAFAAGQLSYCKVRAITRVATPETEPQLLSLALEASGAQLEKIVRAYRGAISATLPASQHAHQLRHLSWNWNEDGSLRLTARLPAEEGALLITAIQHANQPSSAPTDTPTQTYDADPAGANHADALITIARTSLAANPKQRAGGDPIQLVIHTDPQTLTANHVHERSDIEHGPALTPETIRRLACDATLLPIHEHDGKPTATGPRTRTIPPALRRALRHRDHGCRFPGCTHTRYLHAHHIHHWAHGGPTTLTNLINLCTHHHRLVHEGGYTIQHTHGQQPRFRRPNGQEIPPTGHNTPPLGPTSRQQHHTQHPTHPHTIQGNSADQPYDLGLAIDILINNQPQNNAQPQPHDTS
jgi:Domain of unknown function (DUF222)/HNH endonuclease